MNYSAKELSNPIVWNLGKFMLDKGTKIMNQVMRYERFKPSAKLLRWIGLTGFEETVSNLKALPMPPTDIQISMCK